MVLIPGQKVGFTCENYSVKFILSNNKKRKTII